MRLPSLQPLQDDFLVSSPSDRAVPRSSLAINLIAGDGILDLPDALAAFQRAADQWAAHLLNPVTLRIAIDMADLGEGILGQASSTFYTASYGLIRDLVAGGGNSGSAAEAATLPYLPHWEEFSAWIPEGFELNGTMTATRANLLALGVPHASMGGEGTLDATITFSTNFAWDFDLSDGIASGTFCFESVAVHEIGHALGFVSDVDIVDYYASIEETIEIWPTPMDLFRFLEDDLPDSPETFTANPRILAYGGSQFFYTGEEAIPLSTGYYLGDGAQASHWKHGLDIGVMRPFVAPGIVMPITASDLVAMDLIGWQVIPEPGMATLILSGLGMLVSRWLWKRRGLARGAYAINTGRAA